MRKEILTCDRCGKELPKEERLMDVAAGLAEISYTGGRGYRITGQAKAEWCRSCCVEVGFIVLQTWGKYKEVTPLVPAPTLEDLIREIVREEAENK